MSYEILTSNKKNYILSFLMPTATRLSWTEFHLIEYYLVWCQFEGSVDKFTRLWKVHPTAMVVLQCSIFIYAENDVLQRISKTNTFTLWKAHLFPCVYTYIWEAKSTDLLFRREVFVRSFLLRVKKKEAGETESSTKRSSLLVTKEHFIAHEPV